jgi:hypothetical protein
LQTNPRSPQFFGPLQNRDRPGIYEPFPVGSVALQPIEQGSASVKQSSGSPLRQPQSGSDIFDTQHVQELSTSPQDRRQPASLGRGHSVTWGAATPPLPPNLRRQPPRLGAAARAGACSQGLTTVSHLLPSHLQTLIARSPILSPQLRSPDAHNRDCPKPLLLPVTSTFLCIAKAKTAAITSLLRAAQGREGVTVARANSACSGLECAQSLRPRSGGLLRARWRSGQWAHAVDIIPTCSQKRLELALALDAGDSLAKCD